MLRVLDACYSSECVLGSCIARWGSSPDGWPEEHLASVRARHQQLLAEVCAKVCFVPPRSFLPMGRASAPFVAALPATDELQKWPSGAAGSEPVRSGLASMSSGLEGSGLEELLSTPEDEGESPEEALPTLGGYEPADATDSDGRDASAFGRGAGPLADGSPEQQRDSSSSPDDQPAADGDGDGGGKGGAGDGNSVDGDLPTAKAESSEAGLDDRSGTDFLGGNTVSGDGVAEGASSEQAFPSAAPTIASLRIGMGRGSPTEASSSAAGNRAGQHRRQGSDFVFDSPSNKLVLDQAAAIPVDSEPFADSLFGNMGKGDQAFFGAGTVPGGPEPGAAMSPLSKPGPSPGDQGAEPESDNDSSEAGSCCFVEKDVSFGEVFIKDIHEEDGADVHNGIGSPEPSAGENGDGARNNMAGGAMPAGGLGSGTGLPPGLPPGAEAAMAPPGVSHSASTEAQTAKDFSSWDPFGEASSPAIAPGNVPEAFANSCVSEPPSSLSLPGGGPPLSPPESQIPEEPHAGREQPRDCLPSAGPECTASATVLYSFQAEEPGEVSVLQGESVRIVEDAPMLVGSGWTHVCTLNGRTGVVPSGYLQIEGGEGVAPMPAMIPPCQGRVLYNFTGEAEAELTVAAGDLLNIMSTVDGWCKVSRITDGAAGLVPASYIGEAPS
uniref:Transposon ty3-g gag-pol polyprotein n=1 Tax=Tetraselmis sp. GSL018 TaxID=582737 RepID=A0A061QMT7_9CHLO